MELLAIDEIPEEVIEEIKCKLTDPDFTHYNTANLPEPHSFFRLKHSHSESLDGTIEIIDTNVFEPIEVDGDTYHRRTAYNLTHNGNSVVSVKRVVMVIKN